MRYTECKRDRYNKRTSERHTMTTFLTMRKTKVGEIFALKTF